MILAEELPQNTFIPEHYSVLFQDINKVLLNYTEIVNLPKNLQYGDDIIVYNSQTEFIYLLNTIESENRENNFARIKNGVSYFQNLNYKIYLNRS